MPGTTRGRKAAPAKAAKPAVTTETIKTVEISSTPPATEETAEQKRIRELEEKIAALLATQQEYAGPVNAPQDEAPKEGDKITIHFVEDGFTAQGQIWYKGQELEFVVGSPSWMDSLNRRGQSWVLETENEQVEKRGTIYFRRGPWPGKSYTDATWEKEGDAPDQSALERADKLERERRREAPRLPVVSA